MLIDVKHVVLCLYMGYSKMTIYLIPNFLDVSSVNHPVVFIKPELKRTRLDLAKDDMGHQKCCGLLFYQQRKSR